MRTKAIWKNEWDSIANATKIALENGSRQILQCRRIFDEKIKGRLYCLLVPEQTVDELDEHTALAFRANHHGSLSMVKDRTICERLFAEYYASLKDGVQMKRRSNDGR